MAGSRTLTPSMTGAAGCEGAVVLGQPIAISNAILRHFRDAGVVAAPRRAQAQRRVRRYVARPR